MKKIVSCFYAILAAVLFTTSVLAGPSIKLSSVTFSLGSLIADGTLSGIGRTDINVVLDASGIPVITCTNPGKNDVPGQSSPRITASGEQLLDGDSPVRKNGRSPFSVETDDTNISWDAAGCPSSKWTAQIDFVFWTNATLSFYDAVTNQLLLKQDYSCITTRFPPSVTCTPVP